MYKNIKSTENVGKQMQVIQVDMKTTSTCYARENRSIKQTFAAIPPPYTSV